MDTNMKTKIQKVSHDESQSSSSSISAAAQIVGLVDDLLIEIFLRLPMKSLGRFKSVSKHWQSLISDPGFVIRRNPNPNPATGLIFQGPQATNIIYFNDTSPHTRTLDPWPYDTTEIMISCNGLLLCHSHSLQDWNLMRHRYYVFNPTTNKHLTLPQIIQDEPECSVIWLSMCLGFDPSKSPHYKVVCVLELEMSRYQFLVYSSETGCWRKSCVEPFQAASVEFQRGVYWNGAMHWVGTVMTGKSIYFDPDDDRMSQEIMPTPPMTYYDPDNPPCAIYTYYFGESCGHLYYTDQSCSWMVTEFVLYELRRDYSEWFVKFRIHNPSYSIGHHRPYLCSVVQGKSHEDTFSVFVTKGKLVRYNFLNKTLETICEGEGDLLAFRELPKQHAESLCSV